MVCLERKLGPIRLHLLGNRIISLVDFFLYQTDCSPNPIPYSTYRFLWQCVFRCEDSDESYDLGRQEALAWVDYEEEKDVKASKGSNKNNHKAPIHVISCYMNFSIMNYYM